MSFNLEIMLISWARLENKLSCNNQSSVSFLLKNKEAYLVLPMVIKVAVELLIEICKVYS